VGKKRVPKKRDGKNCNYEGGKRHDEKEGIHPSNSSKVESLINIKFLKREGIKVGKQKGS